MLYSDWFAIFSNTTTAVVCIAITLLILSQLQHDGKSRSLGRLTFILGTLAALSVIMRFLALSGQSIHDVFMLITVLTAALPYSMLTFAIDFFGAYRRWYRGVVLLQVFTIAAVAIICLMETTFRSPVIFTDVTISPDGLILYDYAFPIMNYGLLGCAYVGIIVTMQMTVRQYLKARSRVNREMLIGMNCLIVGISIVAIPNIDKFAFEQILYAIGSIILLVSTLRHRLFDPISQYNAALKNRAERLALIQRVGQRANMRLEVKQLLQDVVHEIQQQFHYLAVTIYLSNEENQGYSRVSADSDQIQQYFVEIPQKMVYLATLSQQQRHEMGTIVKTAQSLLWLPIVFGENSTEQRWFGALEMQNVNAHGFSEIDVEVLQILAQQLAVSIRNAQLFEEIRQSNVAKSDFIGYISHEVRNPLANIDNTIDSMLNYPKFYGGTSLPDVFREDATSIRSSAQHLKQLLNDVLDFAKMDAGKLEIKVLPINPLPILDLAVQNGQNTAKAEVEVHALYDLSLPSVLADTVWLRQILLNLVSNATKFTTKGQITLDARVKGQFLEFIVADSGPGIDEERLAMLFQPYAQGNRDLARKYGGVGLGLSICRRLVELQGGAIEAQSKEGEGTIIRFTIPLSENM
jgi:signal transduction histidine kinase